MDWTSTTSNGRSENINGVTASDTPPERRPSFHGDVVHSRPVAINYRHRTPRPKSSCSTAATTACCAPSTATAEPTASDRRHRRRRRDVGLHGARVLRQIKRLRDNTMPINFSATRRRRRASPSRTASTGRSPRIRDGSNSGCSRRMRRGGRRSMRSMSRRSTQTRQSPTLKWRKGCPNQADDTGCTTGFDEHRPDLVRT